MCVLAIILNVYLSRCCGLYHTRSIRFAPLYAKQKKQNSQFVGVAAIPTKLTKKNWYISLDCTDHDLSALYIMNDNRVIEIERGCWQRCLPTPLESFPPSLSSSSVLHFCLLISSFALSTITFSLTHIDNNCLPNNVCVSSPSINGEPFLCQRSAFFSSSMYVYVCCCPLGLAPKPSVSFCYNT